MAGDRESDRHVAPAAESAQLSPNPYGHDGRESGNTSHVASGFTFEVPEELRRRVDAERQKVREFLVSEG